jgi:single-stranded-DNA-specific exonuclease
VQFGAGARLPVEPGEPTDAAVRLEVNRWNGSVEPRLVLRGVQPQSRPIDVLGEPTPIDGIEIELARDLDAWPPAASPEGVAGWLGGDDRVLDARGRSIAGLLADLVASGERVLAVTAHAPQRARALHGRVGGFAMCGWTALEDDPELAAGFDHVVAVDPPPHAHLHALLQRPSGQACAHLAWGEPELRFARRIHEWDFALREPLVALYRRLRRDGEASGEACEAVLTGEGPQPRSPALAGRLVRVLTELDLIALDRNGPVLRIVEPPARTALESSAAFRAYHRRLEDGLTYLSTPPIRSVAA